MHGSMDTNCFGLIIQGYTILLNCKKIWDINDIFI